MKIYLAGPEVFMRDAARIGREKQRICVAQGCVGLFPLDADLSGPGGGELWLRVFDANARMIEAADAVIANLTPFRGLSADVGAAVEVGCAQALGKIVFGYSNNPGSLEQRATDDQALRATADGDGRLWASDGLEVEAFGLADNLMIEGAIAASGGRFLRPPSGDKRDIADLALFEDCVRSVAALITRPRANLARA